MRGSIFDGEARQNLERRLARLSPANERRWGQMNLLQAVDHMANQLRIALGQIMRPPVKSILRNPLMAWLVIHLLPWAKPAASPPSSFEGSAAELSASVATLAALVKTVAEQGENARWAPHPVFGELTGRSWGVLMYRHLDRHLRQFGA